MSRPSPDSPDHSPVVAIQQGAIADYRVGLYRALKQRYGKGFRLYAGETDFHPTIRTVPEIQEEVRFLTNLFFFGRRLLWQKGRFRERLQADVLVLNFNLRIVSHYPMLLLRWLLRRPTLLWGHVKGQSCLTRYFGWLQLFFAKGFICYTEPQQVLLQQHHPFLNLQSFAAPNSCLSRSDCHYLKKPIEDIRDIICVGRLVEYKKVHILVEAYLLARKQGFLPKQVRLVLVGAGPLEESLRQLVAAAGEEVPVVFTGHVSDLDRLRELYSTAFCSVSPGALGLTAIQTFAFGVPLLVAKDEPHGPEAAICHALRFGNFFESDNPVALAQALTQAWSNRSTTLATRDQVVEHVKYYYTFEGMADGFAKAVEYCCK